MSLKVTVLGCGSSGGVPRVGHGFGHCDPQNPKNRRRRCSLLVERVGENGSTKVLVDTSPDLHAQLTGEGVDWLDGVLYTHPHADHLHGIDDLRGLAQERRQRVDVYADSAMSKVLNSRFSYCFSTPFGSDYPPILNEKLLIAGQPLEIAGAGGDIPVLPFEVAHGSIHALGFRFANVAYTPDLNDISSKTEHLLLGLDVWIIDALRYKAHPSHFSLSDALGWIAKLQPRRAILTNLHSDLDYETVRAAVPAHVEPAFDGLCFLSGL